jgi:hypothetical protein
MSYRAVARDQSAARCINCGYSLRGLAEARCPECGRAFNPNDLRTMDVGLPRPQPTEPPSAASHVLSAAVAAVLVWQDRLPGGGNQVVAVLAVLGMATLALAWFILLIAWVARRAIELDCAVATRPRWTFLRWAVTPSLLIGTVLLVVYDVPFRVTFRLSRPFMNSFVSRATPPTAAPVRTATDRWIGLYRTDAIEYFPGYLRFRVSQSGFYTYGFAYSPNGPPPALGRDTYRPIDGKWYAWQSLR